MPKSTGTILVKPIEGEELRFYAESWSDPKNPHLCDLSFFEGNGRCSCKDFDTRRGVAIRAGKPMFSRATSCRHLIAVRVYWMQDELRKRAKLLGAQNHHDA